MRKLLAAAVAALFLSFISSAEVISWQNMSNNRITCMAESKDGNIWLGTMKGLNKYSGMEFISFFSGRGSINDGQSLTNDYITAVCIDSQGRCWAGTQLGVNIAGEFGNLSYPAGVGYERINHIKELNQEYVLVATPSKISKVSESDLSEKKAYYRNASCLDVVGSGAEVWALIYDNDFQVIQVLSPELEEIGRITLPSSIAKERIIGSLTTEDGNVWYYSDRQIVSVNIPTRKVTQRNNPANGSKIQFMVPYKPGLILLGLSGQGLNTYNIYNGQTIRIFHDEHIEDKSSIAFVDSNHSIWVSDPVNVVRIYTDTRFFYSIYHFLDNFADTEIKSIQIGSDERLWCTIGGSLISFELSNGIIDNQYDGMMYSELFKDIEGNMWIKVNDSTLKRCHTVNGNLIEDKTYRFNEPFFDITQDAAGTMWIRFHNKLAYLNEAGVFTDIALPKDIEFVRLICCDGSKEIFLSAVNGLYKVENKMNFTSLMPQNIDSPTNMAKDRNGCYWVGTARGLVRYNPTTGEFIRYTQNDGIPTTNVSATRIGGDGNIWIVTDSDIIRYDLNSSTISNYVDNRFSSNNIYLTNCNTQTTKGSLIFAHTQGLSSINPTNLPPKEDRSIELKSVKVGYDTFLTPEPNVTFSHKQNMLNFWCSTSDPTDGYSIEYKFYLEGFDDGWSEPFKNGWRYYESLPAGEYVFHAAVRNNDGTWSSQTIDFPFRIKPHPLLTTFALIIYFIIGVAIFVGAIWFVMRWRLNREKNKFSAQREVMAKQHIDYLTDISHELKLPLTLIYAPIQELSKSANMNERETDLLHLIEHNVGRMKVLTEQILDSGKYSEEKNGLQVASYNVGQLIKMVTNNYRFVAIDKNLSMTVNTPDNLDCWLDFEKVVKILNNLLSNAIKYTPEGGKIDIDCTSIPDEGRLSITVSDNGIGIPEEKRQSLFDRFERLGYDSAHPDTEGSGVGLNYAQKLAKIHKGIITYYPSEFGGSCFCLTIPVVKAAFSLEEILNFTMPAISSEVFLHNATSGEIKSQSVLIAEDDYELLMYLENLFSTEWNVIGANNGIEAIDSILQIVPDLVISDVSMPRKDGFELCKEIKANDNVSHIPVILLTALNDTQSSITGLESGADAYITKPFDPYYLLAEAKTIVRNRKRVQSTISNLTSTTIDNEETPEEVSFLKDSDRLFLNRLHKIIDDHLNEEGFNASALAKEMNNSYSNFYIKLKALTGQSPQNYLNTYKMNVAMELLKSGEYNVGEVAYKTGFSAISNFSRSFKKQFGITPSEIK